MAVESFPPQTPEPKRKLQNQPSDEKTDSQPPKARRLTRSAHSLPSQSAKAGTEDADALQIVAKPPSAQAAEHSETSGDLLAQLFSGLRKDRLDQVLEAADDMLEAVWVGGTLELVQELEVGETVAAASVERAKQRVSFSRQLAAAVDLVGSERRLEALHQRVLARQKSGESRKAHNVNVSNVVNHIRIYQGAVAAHAIVAKLFAGSDAKSTFSEAAVISAICSRSLLDGEAARAALACLTGRAAGWFEAYAPQQTRPAGLVFRRLPGGSPAVCAEVLQAQLRQLQEERRLLLQQNPMAVVVEGTEELALVPLADTPANGGGEGGPRQSRRLKLRIV